MKTAITTILCLATLNTCVSAITLVAAQDTDVYQYTGSRTGTYFSLNTTPSDAHALKSMIQFEINETTVGFSADKVGSAILRLYVLAPFGERESFTAGDINVYTQTQAWDELTADWNSFVEGELIGSFNVAAHSTVNASAYVEVDITDTVKSWLSGATSNNGLILRTPTTSTGASTAFASREFEIGRASCRERV